MPSQNNNNKQLNESLILQTQIKNKENINTNEIFESFESEFIKILFKYI